MPEELHQGTEDYWDDILLNIQKQHVIPIIGSDILQVEAYDKTMPLDRYVGRKLAERFPATNLPAEPSLYAVVGELLARPDKVRVATICKNVHEILKTARFTPSAVLLKLAEITHFNLFVTTDISSMVEKAIDQVSFGGEEETESIAFDPKNARDLNHPYPGPERKQNWPTVFHLFGKHSVEPDYVFSEETLLEFICALSGRSDRQPKTLFDALKDSSLLILGGNFPDWLARFFLRMARQLRLSQGRSFEDLPLLEILVDTRPYEENLVLFLKHHSQSTKVVSSPGGTSAFIDELSRRWHERNPDPPVRRLPPQPEKNMPDGAVFISYASEDRAAVQKLTKGLESADIPVWFDQSELKSGEQWDWKIRNNISLCSCFIAIISQTVRQPGERYFLKEWTQALERASGLPGDFIFPVVVDGTHDFGNTPPKQLVQLLKYQTTTLAGGATTAKFTQAVSNAVDRNRRRK